jgi:hypothetical protein
MEDVKTWLSIQAQASLAQAHLYLFPDNKCLNSGGELRSSLSMYVFFVCNNFSFFSCILLRILFSIVFLSGVCSCRCFHCGNIRH